MSFLFILSFFFLELENDGRQQLTHMASLDHLFLILNRNYKGPRSQTLMMNPGLRLRVLLGGRCLSVILSRSRRLSRSSRRPRRGRDRLRLRRRRHKKRGRWGFKLWNFLSFTLGFVLLEEFGRPSFKLLYSSLCRLPVQMDGSLNVSMSEHFSNISVNKIWLIRLRNKPSD